MSKPDMKVTITVVLGGAVATYDFPSNQKLEQVVRYGLKAAGREGEDPASWDLKDTAGNVLDQSLKIAEAGVIDGATLHVVAPAGAGG